MISSPSSSLWRHRAVQNLRRRGAGWGLNLVLLAVAFAVFLPIYWLIVTSVLPREDGFELPPKWIPTRITFDNLAAVFDQIPFGMYLLNSVKITVLVTVGALATSVCAAYSFARLQFRGREMIFLVTLASLMIPQQVTIAPTFLLFRSLGLFDTHEAVYLPFMINVLAIFLLRQWFMRIPSELLDAAQIDGAGHLRTLVSVILPLSGPPLSALAILIAQTSWNSFFWPNIMLSSPEKLTVPVGLVQLYGEFESGSPTVIFSAIALLVAPLLVIFLLAQRPITQSAAMTSGIK